VAASVRRGRASGSTISRLAIRDYLRAHDALARQYAEAKRTAWNDGARRLLEYFEAKRDVVAEILHRARSWRGL
jgi:GrpB-like predicted nucleotidyltransferase (UPF0157 family)